MEAKERKLDMIYIIAVASIIINVILIGWISGLYSVIHTLRKKISMQDMSHLAAASMPKEIEEDQP